MRLNILWSKIKFSTFYEGIKDDTRRTNIEALETLKANGITVIPADPAANAVLAEFRDQAVAESVGNRELFFRRNL